MTVFVTGHGDVTVGEFEEHYAGKIRELHRLGNTFCVGDYRGCDLMTQSLLSDIGGTYAVYHMFTAPRNIVRSAGTTTVGGFQNDGQRDAAMIDACDLIVAWVRPGREGSGTDRNIRTWREKKDKNN